MDISNKQQKAISQELLKAKITNPAELNSFKRMLAKKYQLNIISNADILKIYHKLIDEKRPKKAIPQSLLKTKEILVKRPVRSLSGVVNVSVLTKPYPCPGKCIFCPTEKNIPKSYIQGEPAVQRAILNQFHPFKQTEQRLKALYSTGHSIDKVELRIIGGTWSSYPKKYQKWFVCQCFKACNKFKIKNQSSDSDKKSLINSCSDLKKEQTKNEKVKARIVGIAVETRPDCINKSEVRWMRELGITKVELGVQAINDHILQINKRGHLVESVTKATSLLRNNGFKIGYQMMPNLLGSSLKKDLTMFKEMFDNPCFKPDYLKIYPLALLKKTPLYKFYQKGEFTPYSKKELIGLLMEIKKITPQWVRIERIIRDIPTKEIVEGGSKILNLREEVKKEMAKKGIICQCVRCREIKDRQFAKKDVFLFQQEYQASQGKEIFLSFENKQRNALFGLLRLRLGTNKDLAFDILQNTALVRDLKVYGTIVQINNKKQSQSSKSLFAQHQGLGKKLIMEAEKIAKKNNKQKIAVIAGIGARNYYRKLGYKMRDAYMVKNI